MFTPGRPVSSTNKTDHQDITEISLKLALNAINQTYLHKYINMVKHHIPNPSYNTVYNGKYLPLPVYIIFIDLFLLPVLKCPFKKFNHLVSVGSLILVFTLGSSPLTLQGQLTN